MLSFLSIFKNAGSILLAILLIPLSIGFGVLYWSATGDIATLTKQNELLVKNVAAKIQEAAQLRQSLKDCSDNTVLLKAGEVTLREEAEKELTLIEEELSRTRGELGDILEHKPLGATSCEQVENLTQDLIADRMKKLGK